METKRKLQRELPPLLRRHSVHLVKDAGLLVRARCGLRVACAALAGRDADDPVIVVVMRRAVGGIRIRTAQKLEGHLGGVGTWGKQKAEQSRGEQTATASTTERQSSRTKRSLRHACTRGLTICAIVEHELHTAVARSGCDERVHRRVGGRGQTPLRDGEIVRGPAHTGRTTTRTHTVRHSKCAYGAGTRTRVPRAVVASHQVNCKHRLALFCTHVGAASPAMGPHMFAM